MYLFVLIFDTVIAKIAGSFIEPDSPSFTIDLIALSAACWIIFVGAAYFRAENAGKTRWWALVAAIPLISLIAAIYLTIVPPKEPVPAG
jgi:hypothetical protein